MLETSPQEQEFEFDVVGHPKSAFHFVCVFPVIFVDGKPQVDASTSSLRLMTELERRMTGIGGDSQAEDGAPSMT